MDPMEVVVERTELCRVKIIVEAKSGETGVERTVTDKDRVCVLGGSLVTRALKLSRVSSNSSDFVFKAAFSEAEQVSTYEKFNFSSICI